MVLQELVKHMFGQFLIDWSLSFTNDFPVNMFLTDNSSL